MTVALSGYAPLKTGTTSYWSSQSGYIPKNGEIIIYSDYKSKIVDGQTVYIPGVKIGSGNAYVQDLAFISDDIAADLLAHTGDTDIHVTAAKKEFWDNKLNVNTTVVDETLEFTRN